MLPLTAIAVALVAPATSSAATHHGVYFSQPIDTEPYEAEQKYQGLRPDGTHAPPQGGWITAIDSDVVDTPSGKARALPIQDVMIHHLVLQSFTHFKAPLSCGGRFYGRGEEHQRVKLPRGYGLPNRDSKGRAPTWILAHMLMNHRGRDRRVYVRTRVTWSDTPPKHEVDPLFLDAKKCAIDPVYDVPGGGRPGSVHKESLTFRWPENYSGRLVAMAGHLHGGGKFVQLRNRTCRRDLVVSRAYYGMPNHPFYKVKPRLHEASPIRMGAKLSAKGIPVAAGDRVRLTAGYSNRYLHTRVMNIMGGYMVKDPSVHGCPRMPRDVKTYEKPRHFRRNPPHYRVPLVHPPTGPWTNLTSVDVRDIFFRPGRISIRLGTPITWNFDSDELHSVTVTQGPRGFSSPWKRSGLFRYRPRKRGTYQIFCSLHPAAMREEVKVR
jgi:hypothetical protein